MRIAYFDCSAGVAGNMILGALVDAGLSVESLKEQLARLNLDGWTLTATKVSRGALVGTKVDVIVSERQPHRHLRDIEQILDGSSLDAVLIARAKAIFRRLGEAEARMHGVPIEKVHFHEVGAVDAIIDITGAVIGLHALGVERVAASALNVGSGTVHAAHGTLPVPAPATAELLKDVPTYGTPVNAELVTPTGAAVLKTVCREFGAQPLMRVGTIGYGAGTRELSFPNLLRVSIGETTRGEERLLGGEHPLASGADHDEVDVLEANLDDSNPEWVSYALERLRGLDGVLDVWQTPISMKKGRLGTLITVLSEPNSTEAVCTALFRETSTLGVRRSRAGRVKLERGTIDVELPWGSLSLKVGRLGGEPVNVAPEYEMARRLAERSGVPLQRVYEAAVAEGWKRLGRLSGVTS